MTNRNPLDEPLLLRSPHEAEGYVVRVRPSDVLAALTDEQRDALHEIVTRTIEMSSAFTPRVVAAQIVSVLTHKEGRDA